MRVTAWLLCILASVLPVNANVEKTIFVGPSAITFSNVHPSLDDLRLDTLEPRELAVLATQLPVQFPTDTAPRGRESWYILRGLEQGRRYEVRICWPAFQPTDFWLDTFDATQVLQTPDLTSSLAKYIEQRETSPLHAQNHAAEERAEAQSILFLRVQAAASYYSTNNTLMAYPPAVDVDIILDPFILNVLPRSLGPTAIYITAVSVTAWFVSGWIYRWILEAADSFEDKDHKE